MYWIEKIEVGSMKSVFASVAAPAAPQPSAARTNSTVLHSVTRTPSERAASSSSRIACSDAPSGLRSRANTTTSEITAAPSAHQ